MSWGKGCVCSRNNSDTNTSAKTEQNKGCPFEAFILPAYFGRGKNTKRSYYNELTTFFTAKNALFSFSGLSKQKKVVLLHPET